MKMFWEESQSLNLKISIGLWRRDIKLYTIGIWKSCDLCPGPS